MARTFIGSIAPNIHGLLGTEEIENDDEIILYDNSSSANRKTNLSDFIAGIKAKITSIPYVCDYNSLYESKFSKIEAAYNEERPVILTYRGNRLQLVSCDAASAEFYGFRMAPSPEIGYVCIKPFYAVINSDDTRTITDSKSYSPFPGVLTVKLTEKDGTISADKVTDDFAFAFVYDIPIEVLYNGLHYRMHADSSDSPGSGRKFYAIAADEDGVVLHELTYVGRNWSHRTISATGGDLGNVKIPTKTSELENDSGYLTLDTLPKYEGVVE